MRIRPAPGGRFTAENVPLSTLMMLAYNIKEFQIDGGPSWISSSRYDITAEAGQNTTMDQTWEMVRKLLEDRFHLTVHRERKVGTVFELRPAKNGIRLPATREGSCVPVSANTPPPQPGVGILLCGNFEIGKGQISVLGAQMIQLVQALTNVVDHPVLDKTGLTGAFDVHLKYVPDDAATDGAQAADDLSRSSIFTALQEQLGLVLQSSKGPIDMLVIDHVERPSVN